MNKIWILGLGPGHKDYILPITIKKIRESNIIIGGKRNLESIKEFNEEAIFMPLKIPLEDTISYIKSNYRYKQVSVIVSGDPGFYSLLDFLKKNFNIDEIETYSGISSIQYMFSKINISWKDALLSSVHGRDIDLIGALSKEKYIGLLTDNKWTSSKIAKELVKSNYSSSIIYIGENLSYNNERISKLKVIDAVNKIFSPLSVVVIEVIEDV
jgi:cobalt-precorrin-7 (C5)-methyltransferase